MPRAFNRACKVTVGGLVVRDDPAGAYGLDVGFRVERSVLPEPNVANVTIIGLNAEHRRQLGELERVPVVIEAGYQDQWGQIFAGDLRRAVSLQAPFWVTTLETGDGEDKKRKARIAQSFGGKVKLSTVVSALAKALGLGLGNAAQESLKGRWLDGGQGWEFGTTIDGNAAEELTRVLRSAGLEWSIQNEEIQVLEFGRPLGGSAVVLSNTSGLIGSPSIETRDKKRIVKAKSLINPALRPGVVCQVESPAVSASFRVERAVDLGETDGQSWYCDIEGRELS